ncbi:hypothetical protein [Pseudomonas sp. CAM1A]|uniref:hypothetical protein n=1 Tax=Pseudomonas sp. CAM1A TaxID=3231717 RepID=UPI0039C71F78
MATNRACIICGEPAKSNEHIFPAALGGRRTNRGIYCHDHNLGFGKLVARLETQLAMMNGALEVRPDRKDKAKPYFFMDGDTRYRMAGSNIDIDMPPPLDLASVGASTEVKLAVPSLDVAKRWVEANQTDKIKIDLKQTGAPQTHYRTEGNRIQLRFGGCDFLQAVGYLAMTFFAHSFPDAARHEGLKSFKEMLQRDLEDDKANWEQELVWWDGREASSVVGDNPYDFGHTLAVGVCDVTSRAYAYVSFFSCLGFGVDLGPVEYSGDKKTVCTFINPLADRAGDSVTEVPQTIFNTEIGKPGVSLYDMIHSGAASRAVGRFQQKLHARHTETIVADILSRVPPQPVASFEGFEQFMVITQEYGQSLLNLLRKVVDGLAPKFVDHEPAPQVLRSLIAKDESRHNGLTPIAWQVLQLTMKLVALQMHRAHTDGALDSQKVSGLFFGDQGLELITRDVIQPILLARPGQ